MIETRCQAKHRKETWPYVQRCNQVAKVLKVRVEPLDETLDLCEEDYLDYLSSLTLAEARKLQAETGYPND